MFAEETIVSLQREREREKQNHTKKWREEREGRGGEEKRERAKWTKVETLTRDATRCRNASLVN